MKVILALFAVLAFFVAGICLMTRSELQVSSKCRERGGVLIRSFGEDNTNVCIKRDVLIEVE